MPTVMPISRLHLWNGRQAYSREVMNILNYVHICQVPLRDKNKKSSNQIKTHYYEQNIKLSIENTLKRISLLRWLRTHC